jgi:hypothetical protein
MNNKDTMIASLALPVLFIGIMAIMTINSAYASRIGELAINKIAVETMI